MFNRKKQKRIEQQEYVRRVHEGEPTDAAVAKLDNSNPRVDVASFERDRQARIEALERERHNREMSMPIPRYPNAPPAPPVVVKGESPEPVTRPSWLETQYSGKGPSSSVEASAIARIDASREEDCELTYEPWVSERRPGEVVKLPNYRTRDPDSPPERRREHAKYWRPRIHEDIVGGARAFGRGTMNRYQGRPFNYGG